jgi:L-fuculose-phosphate aldolase
VLIGDVREDIVRTCRKLLAAGLIQGTSGNVSARVGDLVAVTPSGLDYEALTPELVGVHGLDGGAVDAPLRPTSELPLHLAVYAATEASAIVHTHSTAATAVSTLVGELPPIHYMAGLFGGRVQVVPYATYGSEELARNAAHGLRESSGCLLANHGAVTTSTDLASAHVKSIYLEWICEVYLRASSAGTPRLLDHEEVKRVAEKLATTYGQVAPGKA